ncbi:unnamed protein product [Durusdinium trenchii]|uniref:Uncharacterized protein n=1 Tax=Durusdinium trenchii TaxID=1381693 RepID=A0ABP0JUF6_9DINO
MWRVLGRITAAANWWLLLLGRVLLHKPRGTKDCSISRCFDPNEEFRLRRVIEAIGTFRFETKIRALGQLILDRDLGSSDGLLTHTEREFFSESVEEPRTAPPTPQKATPEKIEKEDPLIEVRF